MSKKKIKVKVKKRKLKVKRIIVCILLFILIVLICYYGCKIPIKNIYIVGNNIVSDKEIIEMAGISNYPSFVNTSTKDIKSNILKNNYVKKVNVEKKFYNKIYIYITEKKIICSYNDKLLLEDGMEIDNFYNLKDYPLLISDISSVIERFVNSFSLVDNAILLKISEIEYSPNDVDNERFILKMNDGNFVYITLSKIDKINKYNSIYSSLEGRKGIIYLDSGDYVEIKE